MVMKKNRSEEWKALWAESNINRPPLLFTVLVRAMIAIGFIFYICNYLSRFSSAIMVTIGVIVIILIIVSRTIKQRSIKLERLFILNLRSRDIAAHGLMARNAPSTKVSCSTVMCISPFSMSRWTRHGWAAP